MKTVREEEREMEERNVSTTYLERMELVDMDRTESEIRDSIYEYLRKSGVFCWRDYQPTRKASGVGTNRKGVADILGIFKGKPLAIEVKKPGGSISTEQYEWLERFKKQGGIAFVATSVSELQLKISEVA